MSTMIVRKTILHYTALHYTASIRMSTMIVFSHDELKSSES